VEIFNTFYSLFVYCYESKTFNPFELDKAKTRVKFHKNFTGSVTFPGNNRSEIQLNLLGFETVQNFLNDLAIQLKKIVFC
jgi:hypothetical protein